MQRIIETEKPIQDIKQARQYLVKSRGYWLRNARPLSTLKSFNISGRYLEIDYGLADIMVALARSRSDISITGIERSCGILQVAQELIQQGCLTEKIHVQQGSAAF